MFEGALLETLTFIGFSKHEAKVFSHILTKGESRSKEIEKAVDLRQGEVSLALKSLTSKGWIDHKKDLELRQGRGRPYHIYFLGLKKKDIYRKIKTSEENRIEEIRANYQILGNILIPELNKDGCSA